MRGFLRIVKSEQLGDAWSVAFRFYSCPLFHLTLPPKVCTRKFTVSLSRGENGTLERSHQVLVPFSVQYTLLSLLRAGFPRGFFFARLSNTRYLPGEYRCFPPEEEIAVGESFFLSAVLGKRWAFPSAENCLNLPFSKRPFFGFAGMIPAILFFFWIEN